MIEGDKVFGSPPPWTDEMHEKFLKNLKEMRSISDLPKNVVFGKQINTYSEKAGCQWEVPIDYLVPGKQLLKEVLDEQQEVISSPSRFNGVHIEKIKQIFERYGITLEQEF